MNHTMKLAGWRCTPTTLCMPLLAAILLNGCMRETPPVETAVTAPAAEAAEETGILKILVMTDGKVLVDGEEVPLEEFEAKLDSLAGVSEVWYHREDPEAPEPHPNAITVLYALMERDYTIHLYADPEYKLRIRLE